MQGLDMVQAAKVFDSTMCTMDYGLTNGKPQWNIARFESAFLRHIDIFRDTGMGVRSAARTYRHIREDSVRDFLLCVPLDSRSFVLQGGTQTYCAPGSFRLHSAAKPFSASVEGVSTRGRYSQITARVSGPLLRQEVPGIDHSPNLVLDIRSGTSRIMKSLLELALTEGHTLSDAQARDFGKTVVHAIAAALLDALKPATSPHTPSRRRLADTAMDFIADNLSNPALDCAMIAQHCRVSTTYLHMVFAASSMRIGAYIREARLQECRAALRNPALRHEPISNIAMNWGFDNPTSFSRSYKARFGKTPRHERNDAI